jgi:predicted transcriptional regulator
MKTLSLRLPEELDTRVGAIARQRGCRKSEVVRNALEAYLAGEASLFSGSALDLAGNLVGALDGPVDLSYHQKHMRGYGE